jgi:DNA-binding IclR family transcriptional regulator
MAKAVSTDVTKVWNPGAGGSAKQKSSALKKATQVLDLVVSEDFGISASELAVRLKIPRQTAHRTVRALEEMGFLIRTVSREKYEIGPTLRQLANKILMTTYRRGPWHAILE